MKEEAQTKTIILNADEINKKIERIAYQIWEDNYEEKELYLLGVKKRGSQMAEKIAGVLQKICNIKIECRTIFIDKAAPNDNEIALINEIPDFDHKTVILVDDVASTGRTLCYAIKPLLEHLPKKLRIAVLVDRQHKTFPVCCDFVGLSLSTTLQNHIRVDFDTKVPMVYLT